MARIQITSSVTSEENKIIENQAAMDMLTKYKFIRKAVLKYCEECKHGREERSRVEGRGQEVTKVSY